MKVKTHPDFKSVYSEITNADMMDDYVGYGLENDKIFSRRTLPWEKTLWEDEELENFNIDLEKVDRLYYIYNAGEEEGVDRLDIEMAARMDYKGRKVYFELFASWASCDCICCIGSGSIFVSGDANLFMKLVIRDKYSSNLIYQSLREDGIRVEELTEYEAYSRFQKNSAPTLKFLCHLTMYKNKNPLEASFSQLPKPLEKSVKSFIQTMDAKKAYNTWY